MVISHLIGAEEIFMPQHILGRTDRHSAPVLKYVNENTFRTVQHLLGVYPSVIALLLVQYLLQSMFNYSEKHDHSQDVAPLLLPYLRDKYLRNSTLLLRDTDTAKELVLILRERRTRIP